MHPESEREHLPEGCELRLDFYLVSDSAGLETKLGLGGLTHIPSIRPGAPMAVISDISKAVADGLGMSADDWRFMTRDEIADYKDREDED